MCTYKTSFTSLNLCALRRAAALLTETNSSNDLYLQTQALLRACRLISRRNNSGERRGGVPTLKTERQESRASVFGHRPGQTLRQNQVTLSHIHRSASVRLPAPAQRELSSGPCRGISRYGVERKSGAVDAREREGELLNAISRD